MTVSARDVCFRCYSTPATDGERNTTDRASITTVDMLIVRKHKLWIVSAEVKTTRSDDLSCFHKKATRIDYKLFCPQEHYSQLRSKLFSQESAAFLHPRPKNSQLCQSADPRKYGTKEDGGPFRNTIVSGDDYLEGKQWISD